ncbi:hypothetical protein KUCAC02_007801 [Chaenocephalus aceratus]|uniref:Uncharacterized protein n=1 Tax=Chaenocephalus aceratus TaxID=36190 RepID=A0ACB9X7H4_CHAAC|nr:hypothetical protein KUCAC02_007801 [Chaenocephalus aceratus]
MIKKISISENEFDIPAKNCHRMVIMGSTKVGKTSIISRFLNERVDDQYTPTIEDFHRKTLQHQGRRLPAGHFGHIWKSSLPCNEEAINSYR